MLWAVSNIAGSLLGAASTKWFKGTKLGVWCYQKFDQIAVWAAERYGVDILDKEDITWRTQYPKLALRVDLMEDRIAHLENLIDEKVVDKKRGA